MGLGFDFLGAVLLVRGLLRQQATIILHIAKESDHRNSGLSIRKLLSRLHDAG
jgi:hypothetical protein